MAYPITHEVLEDLKECFDKTDPSFFNTIEEIHYFNGWSGYEESGGIIVFNVVGQPDLFMLSYGYSVYSGEYGSDLSQARVVSMEEALAEMEDMDAYLKESDGELT